jgi:tRNA pseudouridine32 synthase / 23S rRNA pseudouridine746 synthase
VILHLDSNLLIVNKPAGLLSVPGRGVENARCVQTEINSVVGDTLIVHRLDQATSGLMILARNALTQKMLSVQFAARQIKKTYTSIVHGLLSPSEKWQSIDLPLSADWPYRPRQKIDPNGKPSTTLWRCTAQFTSHHMSLLELIPLSGRTHQLRVHLQSIGHPIVGDTLYFDIKAVSDGNSDFSLSRGRMLLHASCLEFEHPNTKENMHFKSGAEFLDAFLLNTDTSQINSSNSN